MVIEIDLKPEVEAMIKAQAQARGVSIGDLIASLLEGLNGALSEDENIRLAGNHDASEKPGEDVFIQAMESMAADVPPLPRDFSREDIYFPRD